MYVLWMILEAAVVGALGYFFVLSDPQDRTGLLLVAPFVVLFVAALLARGLVLTIALALNVGLIGACVVLAVREAARGTPAAGQFAQLLLVYGAWLGALVVFLIGLWLRRGRLRRRATNSETSEDGAAPAAKAD